MTTDRLAALLHETIPQPAEDGPCVRCGYLRDSGTHDTAETCDEVRGPCLDPQRHHPYQPAQPAPDALPVYGKTEREDLRTKIDRELCRDGQLDWDECSRLADLLSVAIWNELSMFPIAQPAPDALRAAAQAAAIAIEDAVARQACSLYMAEYAAALRAALGDEP